MRIFCSGIGGIGLSAYASHMNAQGHEVYGSDNNDSVLISDVRSQGVKTSLKQDGSAMPENLDLFVYSEAIPETAPERVLATKRGVRQISYFKALGEMTEGKRLISICGTHGKSSTTAITARLLMESGLDPSIVVGTKLRELGKRNWRQGSGELWAVESCEYRRSFHFLSPKIILVTNTDGDHFDAYKDLPDYEQAFVEFFRRLPDDGVIIAHGGDGQTVKLVKESGKRMIDADTQPMITLKTPGKHMQQNAQLVLALAELLGLDPKKSREIVSGYAGSWRRLEIKGSMGKGTTVIDDYGHHPVEIKATLAAVKSGYAGRRVICVFQPHTHDRTLKLWNDFAAAFKDADAVLVTNIYDARPDKDREKADVQSLAADIRKKSGAEVTVTLTLDDAEKALRETIAQENDVIVTMGAGDVTKLSDRLVQ